MKSFWMYKASETPSLEEAIEAGAINRDTTQVDWNKLTPGMKREIVRTARKSETRAKLASPRDARPDETEERK